MRSLLLALCLTCAASSGARALVVCADPNDLPFSNQAGQGFENKIVALLAKDMDTPITYLWWPQLRGFVRKTLNASKCDLWPGVASGLDRVTVTQPYYRSTYVFVSRRKSAFQNLTLDDSRLKRSSIGVQMIGNDATNTPPAHAIASRGITDNVRGFMIFGDAGRPNPKEAIINAVEHGHIDVALVWGPLAGYFAKTSSVPLRIEPITPADDPRWPMAFDISFAVRKGDLVLRDKLNAALERDKPAVDAILRSYGVPLTQAATPKSDDVTVIDGSNNSVVGTIPVGKRPRGIHVSPDGKTVYVAVSGTPVAGPPELDAKGNPILRTNDKSEGQDAEAESGKAADGIAMVDVASNRLTGKIVAGSDPEEFALSKDGARLFISNEDAMSATVINIAAKKVEHMIRVGAEPDGVATTPDGKSFCVTCEAAGDVFVVDTETYGTVAQFNVGARPRSVAFMPEGNIGFVPAESLGELNIIDAMKTWPRMSILSIAC